MKIFGIFSILLTWVAILLVLTRTSREMSKSISHHAALKRPEYYIFALLMTISVISMWVFMVYWVVPALQLSIGFTVLFSIAATLEIITTLIPLTSGWRRKVHETTSYGAALLVAVMIGWILTSPVLSTAATSICLIAIVGMIVFFLLYFFVKSTHKHHLVYQSLYVALFHLSLLTLIVSQ